MADFKAKMHQIVCRLGLRPRPRWGSLQCSPRPPSWILGGLLLREGRGGERRGGEGKGGEGKGGEGKGRGPPALLSHPPPSHYILDKDLLITDTDRRQTIPHLLITAGAPEVNSNSGESIIVSRLLIVAQDVT